MPGRDWPRRESADCGGNVLVFQAERVFHANKEVRGVEDVACPDHAEGALVPTEVFGGEGVAPSTDEVAACVEVASP
jgi:hypothetical protein